MRSADVMPITPAPITHIDGPSPLLPPPPPAAAAAVVLLAARARSDAAAHPAAACCVQFECRKAVV